MQLPAITRLSLISLPPLYTWPKPVKRIILTLASLTCLAAYLMLLAGLVGVVMVLLDLG